MSWHFLLAIVTEWPIQCTSVNQPSSIHTRDKSA